ncbi:MAG TPA: biotin--[acetyl-CoA-carboxylase] ligase [Solirubrobacteraceae bacterium]|jgi:BirA family biotin operon repressor/biotin-[acetyl-CoA-carboxylase] ligase|nr:biotin--[acetyl-CoA-carboxylase] ligase [Solirubrobacteraceae bacterium]
MTPGADAGTSAGERTGTGGSLGPRLGRPRVHLRRTDSTNDRARELALAGAPHGTLVTAAEQTAGRGRQGRRWSAPAGEALLMSLLLREPPALLPLIAALAVCDAAGGQARIKWPNDVVFVRASESGPGQLSKLAGILAEGRPQEGWAVLGIGLNVAVRLDRLPPELHETAATLGREPQELEPTLGALIGALERRLAEPTEQTLDAWRARDALRGRMISWRGGEGRAEGVDGAGRLVVSLDGGGRTALDAGEVHLQLG